MRTKILTNKGILSGQKKYTINQLEVFKILSEQLGFKSININGRNKLLKNTREGYKFVSIHFLRESFVKFLEEDFDLNTLPKEVSRIDLLNMFYKEKPITSSYARAFFHNRNKLNPKDFKINGEFITFK